MSTGFPGFPAEGITFLRGVARNNNREWFLPRKPVFEEKLRRPMFELVESLNTAMKQFAPEYVTEPSKAILRFYRDTRFSKDKSPYKDHMSAGFSRRGLSCGGAGYYFAVSHKNVGIGGGVYMPLPPTLMSIRNHLADRHQEFRRIVEARSVRGLFGELQGEQLSRVPKGFAKEHPAEDLLRRKQFLLWVELPLEIATSPELFAEVRKHFRAMVPFLEFLNKPLAESQKPANQQVYSF